MHIDGWYQLSDANQDVHSTSENTCTECPAMPSGDADWKALSLKQWLTIREARDAIRALCVRHGHKLLADPKRRGSANTTLVRTSRLSKGKLNAECPCKADIRVVRSKSATGPVYCRISRSSVFVHTQCAIIFTKASPKEFIQLDSFQQYAESTPDATGRQMQKFMQNSTHCVGLERGTSTNPP
ncbi:hypothetical protein XU18_3475 [Perkinsela sp. CCAP 1560/4]|nr:hypothetical protein XU18_3475 [Perkinsela sp. CCAP 1560/4]|eukprot:KNH05504.1 hypothetical protein XU18_3475 [Perkinsela sp. CCAP 1560/4]